MSAVDLGCRLVAVGLLLAGACGGRPAAVTGDLHLVGVEPTSGLLHLNQEITLKFDRRLDPASVTEDTVRIVDETGGRVPGRLRARSFTITFLPVIPTTVELDDGSFRPGRAYACELPAFPRANSLRGARGEILRRPERRSWRAVDADSLPVESPSFLLPSGEAGRLQVARSPLVAADGSWIELHFDRPVYPRSARPAAFKLLRDSDDGELALRSVRAVASDGPWRGSRVLRLEPAQPLPPGTYRLWFQGGADAIRDYRLAPAVLPVPVGPDGVRWQEQGYLHLLVEHGQAPALVEERFARLPDTAVEPGGGGLCLADDAEGYLGWGPIGLWAPALPADFATLGSFRPATTQILKAGASVEIEPGRTVRLPDDRWDFDRFVVPRGVICYVVVDGARGLSIRVAGRLDVQGQVVFRFVGEPPRLPASEPATPARIGDPTGRWMPRSGHVVLLVNGLCRLHGSIARRDEPAGPASSQGAGYLLGRGPFLGDWTASALELWRAEDRQPDPAPDRAMEAARPRLPGRWLAVSSWYALDGVAVAGRYELTGGETLSDTPVLEVLVQERLTAEGEGGHAWVMPSLLAARGPLQALRFAVLVSEPFAAATLARAIRLW